MDIDTVQRSTITEIKQALFGIEFANDKILEKGKIIAVFKDFVLLAIG